jgi:RHS repeat-associated protein
VRNDEKFTYDVNNNRIAVSLNGTPQLYTVYDGANPYMDFNGSGQLTERYLYNPNALSQFYGQVSASGTVQWFLTDNINSIRQVVSAGGTVLDAITYDPYGNILNQTNSANAPRFLYTGGAVDSLTGNYQFDARSYGPVDGRFMIQDWSGFAAGDTNLYRYVFNAPLYRIDPSGLQPPPSSQQQYWMYQWQNRLSQITMMYARAASQAVAAGASTGTWGGATEGTAVGVGWGITVGLAVTLGNPLGGILGGIIGGYLGGSYGYQQGNGQSDFFGGVGAAATLGTINQGIQGGLAGGSIVGIGSGIGTIASGLGYGEVGLAGGGTIGVIVVDGGAVVGGLVTTGLGILGGVAAYSTGSPPDQPPENGGPDPRVIQAQQIQEAINSLREQLRLAQEQHLNPELIEDIERTIAILQGQLNRLFEI